MTRSTVAIVALSVSLAATNLWWFYHEIDVEMATLDRESVYTLEHVALAQTFAILPIVARTDSMPAEVLAAASKAAARKDSFQKDGFTWVGELGLRFTDAGRLSAVEPAWQPF